MRRAFAKLLCKKKIKLPQKIADADLFTEGRHLSFRGVRKNQGRNNVLGISFSLSHLAGL